MVKPKCSNYRIFTAICFGVRNFLNFYGYLDLLKVVCKKNTKEIHEYEQTEVDFPAPLTLQ